MKAITYIEVPVHFQVVRVRQLSPFQWALLRAMQVFVPGLRPELGELTKRLCLGEPIFLNEAWRELLEQHAVDDAVFPQARLTMEGEEALRTGCFPVGSAVENKRAICFTRDGELLSTVLIARHGEPRTAKPLACPPPWSDAITASQIERFLRPQTGADRMRTDERWHNVRLAWNEALEVSRGPRPAAQSSNAPATPTENPKGEP